MSILSKNRIKYIRSLELKKIRKEEKVFLAEGPKLVGDVLGYFPCKLLIATSDWLEEHPAVQAAEVIEVTSEELSRTSLLKTPQQVLALFEQPEYEIDMEAIRNSLCLALDDIQDPGNLGTIIRLADWFGIEHIFCSPKTIQATMGGIARVKVYYTALPDLMHSLGNVPVYGTLLDGENMYEQPLSKNGIIIMGNEGNGISPEIEKLVNRKLYIPESLNVAIATAIVCAEFRRQAAL